MKIKRIKELNANQQSVESHIKLLLDFPEICLNQNITLHYTVHESFAETTVFRKKNLSKVGFGSSRPFAVLSHTDCQILKIGKIFYHIINVFKVCNGSTYRPEIFCFKFVYLIELAAEKKTCGRSISIESSQNLNIRLRYNSIRKDPFGYFNRKKTMKVPTSIVGDILCETT